MRIKTSMKRRRRSALNGEGVGVQYTTTNTIADRSSQEQEKWDNDVWCYRFIWYQRETEVKAGGEEEEHPEHEKQEKTVMTLKTETGEVVIILKGRTLLYNRHHHHYNDCQTINDGNYTGSIVIGRGEL